MLRRSALALALACAPACTEPASSGPARVVVSHDKRALFGDPKLVPTREGERLRREIALAGEIEQALRLAPELEDQRVVVQTDAGTTRIAVFLRISSSVSEAEVLERTDAVVTAIAGASTDRSITLAVSPHEEPAPSRRLDLALAVALLGLGASMGMTADRMIRRLR